MKLLSAAVAAAFALPLMAAGAAHAEDITRVYATPEAAIASLTRVPAGYDLVFLAGATPGSGPNGPKIVGTEAQTFDVLTKLQKLLADQGMTMGDIVQMRVFLQVDPEKGNHADRVGMNAAFKKFFGTADQPNKPARTTVVVSDGNGTNFVEIDAIAAKKPMKAAAKKK
jgi:enamine deaminase RidA (YjgF/YER057c/UK114 family)